MPSPPRVVEWLQRNYQKPAIDPEWLQDCCAWLAESNGLDPETSFQEFVDAVKNQLLASDLTDSMQHGTGLPVHIGNFTGVLPGPPVLVQIVSMTEIGSSAFQLEQIRVAREERIKDGVGDEEGDEDGDIEVEGEGPMPKYPRGTLRFQLSDGATILQAMEYRHLPDLSLGNTPLGYKLHLKGTRIQDGMAFLEPATVVCLGGRQSDLNDKQDDDLKRGFHLRLGVPLETMALAQIRSPLRDIPPPAPPVFPQHNDDWERPRRLPANSNLAASMADSVPPGPRPIIPLRRSLGGLAQLGQHEANPSFSERSTLAYALSSQNSTSPHFDNNPKTTPSSVGDMDIDTLDFNKKPTTRQVMRIIELPAPAAGTDDSFDFDLLDEINENIPPIVRDRGKGLALSPGLDKGAKPSTYPSSDYGMDDGDDDDDPDFLEDLARVEENVLSNNAMTITPSLASSLVLNDHRERSVTLPSSTTLSSSDAPHSSTVDVIEIDDSGDDEKENMPVHVRYVRQRTETMNLDADDEDNFWDDNDNNNNNRPRLQSQTQPPATQSHRRRPFGQPVVLATDPNDIIDLSDSD